MNGILHSICLHYLDNLKISSASTIYFNSLDLSVKKCMNQKFISELNRISAKFKTKCKLLL